MNDRRGVSRLTKVESSPGIFPFLAIKNVHRLGAVMEYKGEIYPVKLTVKEKRGSRDSWSTSIPMLFLMLTQVKL